MTTKQIAEYVGKPERTVQRWAKTACAKMASAEAKMASAQRSGGTPPNWDFEETISIIEVGMGANAAAMYRANATNQPPQVAVGSTLTPRDLELISSIVAMTLQKMDQRVSTIESRIESRQALLPAPGIKPRDNVNKIVREYAKREEVDHSTAWGDLYREFGYRTNSNPKVSAKNRGMSVIDYIEAEGMIETLEAIAMDWGK